MPFSNLAYPEQQKIADILGTLDDKIELNRQMNRTLEAMARAIFKAWFVDFEPVKAKAAGATRFRGMPQAVFDQLPDRFTDTELGAMPKGWEVTFLRSLASIKGGKQLPSERRAHSGMYRVFGANGVMGFSSRSTHDDFVIVFGRVGACGSIHWSYSGAWVNNNASAIVPDRWNELVLQAMQSFDFTAMRRGSAQPFIPNSTLGEMPLVQPTNVIAQSFCTIVGELRLFQNSINQESKTLAAIRDTLLPKLISGELRVSVAEEGADGD